MSAWCSCVLLVLGSGVGLAGTATAASEPAVPGMEVELAKRVETGLDHVACRQYPDALHHFRQTNDEYPDSAVGPLGRAIVFQAMMLENEDLEYTDAYRKEADEARGRVERALRAPGNDTWNEFLYAAVSGLDGLDALRARRYFQALNLGWAAIESIKRTRRSCPDFVDPSLGTGIYDYWRTDLAERLPMVPSAGDHKERGIDQMIRARDEGVYVGPFASFALAYTYRAEGSHDLAIAEGLALRKQYPENIINLILLGRNYIAAEERDAALEVFEAIRRLEPDIRRVLWYLGLVHLMDGGDAALARGYFDDYLEQPIPDRHRAKTHLRLADIALSIEDRTEVVRQIDLAVAADPTYRQAEQRRRRIEETWIKRVQEAGADR